MLLGASVRVSRGKVGLVSHHAPKKGMSLNGVTGKMTGIGLSKIMAYIEYVLIILKEYDYNIPSIVFSVT